MTASPSILFAPLKHIPIQQFLSKNIIATLFLLQKMFVLLQHNCSNGFLLLKQTNMKKLSIFICAAVLTVHVQASEDTLKNHADGLTLVSDKYTGTGEWGYFLGHNHHEQQQFAEKYYVDDHVHVLGVVVHLTGTVTHTDNEAYCRVFEVKADGLPGAELEHGHIDFGDLDLTGGANVILFHDEAHVEDSFFVSFDLGDYAHGGHEGDTIGVLYAPAGSRNSADLAKFGRNVIQEHGHGSANWSDVYSQSFLNLATHLAIYPVVEFEDHHNSIKQVSGKTLAVTAPYPNPAAGSITIPYTLKKDSDVTIEVTDMGGRSVQALSKGGISAGSYTETLDLSRLPNGLYHVVVRTDSGALAVRISKIQ